MIKDIIYPGEEFEEFPRTSKDARKILKKHAKLRRRQDQWTPWLEAIQILLSENKALRREVKELINKVKWSEVVFRD